MDKNTKVKIRHLTLQEFAEATDCHFSTASRLMNGERNPGRELLGRIIEAFDLDRVEAVVAYVEGADQFGAYLRKNVFDVEETVSDEDDDDSTEDDEDTED